MTALSPFYGNSRFDDLSNGMRRMYGERLHFATEVQRKKPTRSGNVPIVEFTAAAHEHGEPAFDVSQAFGASSVSLGPFDIPATGYIRGLWLVVTLSGGTIGTPVTHEDYPFRMLTDIAVEEPNGTTLYSAGDGYDLFLTNLYNPPLGFMKSDPRDDPDYVATANAITSTYALFVPVEIFANNGFGSIANQNAAGAFKFRCSLRSGAEVWTTPPTAYPTARVRGYVEAWTQPNPTDLGGRPQAVIPPMHGTAQYVTRRFVDVAAGEASIPLTRVGNLLRKVIFVYRVSNARNTAGLPDPFSIDWDGRRLINNEPRMLRRAKQSKWYEHASAGVPAGVLVWDMDHDLIPGNGTPELWLPTVQSSRIEFRGTFASAGQLEIITVDVAPVEVSQEERYMERNASGGVGPLSERG